MTKEKNTCSRQRNSSIELYRIIATFTVLIVHFNGWFLGDWPLPAYDIDHPALFRTGQMIISAAVIICVNMFVIISGYFGIRLKLSSIVKLYVYLLLIYVPLYLVRMVSTHEFVLADFIEKFFVISYAGYFIQCYFMLMIVSPLLNAFIEKYQKRSLVWVLLFFMLEFWFACVMEVEEMGHNHGYSVIHFVLMYMIARCIRLYEDDIKKVSRWVWVSGYVLCTVVIIVCHILGIEWGWDYSSPIVVVSSVCSFLPFLYKTYYNKVINWIASGTLAVYIIHVTHRIQTTLETVDRTVLETNSYPMYLLIIAGVILMVFVASALYGVICNRLSTMVSKHIDKRTKGFMTFE